MSDEERWLQPPDKTTGMYEMPYRLTDKDTWEGYPNAQCPHDNMTVTKAWCDWDGGICTPATPCRGCIDANVVLWIAQGLCVEQGFNWLGISEQGRKTYVDLAKAAWDAVPL